MKCSLAALFVSFCGLSVFGDVQLETLVLPEGFEIAVWADSSRHGLTMPRHLHVESLRGATIVYVGTGDPDDRRVRALVDLGSTGEVDRAVEVFRGEYYMVPSLAVDPATGQLYAAEPNNTWVCQGNANAQVLQGNLPLQCSQWMPMDFVEGWEYHSFHHMDWDPKHQLCIARGVQCNECIPSAPYSTIECYLDADTEQGTIYAHGIRNSVGFGWHPDTKEMWFTDNGRDDIGANPNSQYDTNNHPDCELNRIETPGQNFGYPYCHSGGNGDPYQRDAGTVYAIIDPDEGSGDTDQCTQGVTLAAQPLGPHIAPLGMHFYIDSMFPEEYYKGIFVAEHGSWDRTPLIGYRVGLVTLNQDGTEASAYDIFAQGWLNDTTQEYWGRPVSLAALPDGSMLLSDDQANVIYRITYQRS